MLAWSEPKLLLSQKMSLLTTLFNPRNFRLVIAAIATTCILFVLLFFPRGSAASLDMTRFPDLKTTQPPITATETTHANLTTAEVTLLTDLTQYFTDYPIEKPFKERYGELGRRLRIVRDWLTLAQTTNNPTTRALYQDAIEQVVATQFPFLTHPSHPATTTHPLATLRASFTAPSAGIVIPTSDKTVRYAAHLIGALRSVLNSTLPIQVVYAGDSDLAARNRDLLASLAGPSPTAPTIEFLDILTVFDDATLQLQTGGWAIKAFAALASRFETVILADADAVFFQQPEVLLEHEAFVQRGALLFHDRLLWQYAFEERHQWWHSQIRRPSAVMNDSRVWVEKYAEEGDSGLVVLNKGRAEILVGLLHVCWQNSYEVREETTYKITYGDKESWWFGLELAGAEYEFSRHYGGIVGWESPVERGAQNVVDGVCSFVIAHVDARDRLLWWNGSLLKNKGQLGMENEYQVPEKWMIDAEWVKGARKQDASCMVNGVIRDLTGEEKRVLERSIELAQSLDKLVQLG
ncbi:uncharacterized protein BP01DRAFT_359001 [Aspergillus saccharolyticus JOP 1030-1]|uniref:Glycosyltransferase family 71 protein n=1 Tax=Aspergillus saccharolyticus JOP 1030-1 TaxID=1450539 RepID=A0A318Z7A3_9EURO|nr:hypothetical protein BP01DRAFT_359001 [Aspergillus saccharolyticus JOP 1030-1]PYH43036.1 hypothetical protein BP01DRAFT_359001 [Aspergillus saccharolyticus JOP 1030-1]